MRILIDSSYLCALYNTSDSLHKKALCISSNLKNIDSTSVISDYIFLETMTVLSQRLGKYVSNKVGKSLLNSETFELIHIDSVCFTNTWKLFQILKDKDFSYVDCSNILLMKDMKINSIITLDKGFEKFKREYQWDFSIID